MIPGPGQLTVYDLQNLKGKRQIMMTNATDSWTARAAQDAGFDVLNTRTDTYESMVAAIKEVKSGAPNLLISVVTPIFLSFISDEEAVRGAVTAIRAGADMVFPLALPDRVAAIAKQGIPCAAHVGLNLALATWFGGPRGFGKTSEEALNLYKKALAYQEAGAVILTIECVADRVAAEIAKRLTIPVISLGSGSGCDGVNLFSSDILGTEPSGWLPRHAKKYRDFFKEAVAAFKECKDEVESGAYPARDKLVDIRDEEFELFMKGVKDL